VAIAMGCMDKAVQVAVPHHALPKPRKVVAVITEIAFISWKVVFLVLDANEKSAWALIEFLFLPKVTLPYQAQYTGCFQDSPNRRDLNGSALYAPGYLTVQICQRFCYANGMFYAGLQQSYA
jgi:hypothetical protein